MRSTVLAIVAAPWRRDAQLGLGPWKGPDGVFAPQTPGSGTREDEAELVRVSRSIAEHQTPAGRPKPAIRPKVAPAGELRL